MAPGHADNEELLVEGIPQAGGAKRKRGEPKFYAVRDGKAPGIYHNWADCLAQIKGYRNAACKIFSHTHNTEPAVSDRN